MAPQTLYSLYSPHISNILQTLGRLSYSDDLLHANAGMEITLKLAYYARSVTALSEDIGLLRHLERRYTSILEASKEQRQYLGDLRSAYGNSSDTRLEEKSIDLFIITEQPKRPLVAIIDEATRTTKRHGRLIHTYLGLPDKPAGDYLEVLEYLKDTDRLKAKLLEPWKSAFKGNHLHWSKPLYGMDSEATLELSYFLDHFLPHEQRYMKKGLIELLIDNPKDYPIRFENNLAVVDIPIFYLVCDRKEQFTGYDRPNTDLPS
ncbi:MAG: hypothetical protein R2880_03830 [Deinococcales bacterium]